MNHIKTKTKLVFIPLMLYGIIFSIGYALLYWVFYIDLHIISVKEDIIQLWVPVTLSFILILLFIRPRVHLLKLDKDNGRIRGLYYLVGAAVICIPAFITLQYLDSATGKLTNLENIETINTKPPTKFYTVNSYVLNKSKIGVQSVISRSGKHNQYLNFTIYLVIPFTSELGDTLRSPSAFLSVKYQKQISSRISDTEREREWNIFRIQSFANFEYRSFYFKYLNRLGNTDDRDNFIIAARKSPLYEYASPIIILKAYDESFEDRNGNRLAYIFMSFAIGSIVWFIMILIPGLHENKAKRFDKTKKRYIVRELNATYNMFKPRPGFTATPVLIVINTLFFLIMALSGLGVLSFYTRDLIYFGALYEPNIKNGEWWRLITAMFLHGGIIHLFMNMVGLYISGIFLENFIGTKKFLFIYLISGIVAGLVSIGYHDKPMVAVGASGAIFGLYGILLYMAVFIKIGPDFKKFMLILLACTAGFSLLMGFLSEGIDNSAHIGGLIAGFALGKFFSGRIEQKDNNLFQ